MKTRKRIPWTKEDEEKLVEYVNKGYSNKEISKKLNRTIASINWKRADLIKAGKLERTYIAINWTEKEIKMMLEMEKKGFTDKEIAYELGRERQDITAKRGRMRLKGEYQGRKGKGGAI